MSRKLVVNLLVYADLVKEGAKQAELLPRVASAQAQAAEVRREWIQDLPAELPVLAQGAKENGLELFYSIPLPLFAAGRLDEAANNDKVIMGVGMVLFWPALFALGGTKQQEADYARLKGEYEAIGQAMIAKKCDQGTAPASAANAASAMPVATPATPTPPEPAR